MHILTWHPWWHWPSVNNCKAQYTVQRIVRKSIRTPKELRHDGNMKKKKTMNISFFFPLKLKIMEFFSELCIYEPPHDKTNKTNVRPAKTQITLGIRPVWSESSLCAQWVAKDPRFLHADSEDSDQTGRNFPGWSESSLGAHAILLVLSLGGSYNVVVPVSHTYKPIFPQALLEGWCS